MGQSVCVCVCSQPAQLELEAQRAQLEQEDAADAQVSPEALHRVQQQVALLPAPCLHHSTAT